MSKLSARFVSLKRSADLQQVSTARARMATCRRTDQHAVVLGWERSFNWIMMMLQTLFTLDICLDSPNWVNRSTRASTILPPKTEKTAFAGMVSISRCRRYWCRTGLHKGLPALLLIFFRCFEVGIAVRAPRKVVAVQAQGLAFPFFLATAPGLRINSVVGKRTFGTGCASRKLQKNTNSHQFKRHCLSRRQGCRAVPGRHRQIF